MSTKNISITEEAYNRLANLRKKDESFSKIIVELTGKARLSDFYGILSKEAGEALEKSVKESRKRNAKNRLNRILRISKELSE